MLSRLEKEELLQDANSEARRDAFRQTLIKDALHSFDDYLKYLNHIPKTFPANPPLSTGFSRQNFKL